MDPFQHGSAVKELAHQVQFLKGRVQESLARLEELQQTMPKVAAKAAAGTGTKGVLPARVQQQERQVLEQLKLLARVQGQLGQALMED